MTQIQAEQKLHCCPYCGGKIVLRHDRPIEVREKLSGYWIDWVRLECEDCGSYTPSWYAGESEAIRAWNLITEPSKPEPKQVSRHELSALKPCPNCGGKGKLTPYIDKWSGQQHGYYVACEVCGTHTYVCACETPAIDDWDLGCVITR